MAKKAKDGRTLVGKVREVVVRGAAKEAAPVEDREGHGRHGVVSSESLERMAARHRELSAAARAAGGGVGDPFYVSEMKMLARVHAGIAHVLSEEAGLVRKLYVRG